MAAKNTTLHLSISRQWAGDIAFLANRVAAEKRRSVSNAEMVRMIIEEYLISKAEILPRPGMPKPTVVVNPFAEEDEQDDESPEETDEDFYRNNK